MGEELVQEDQLGEIIPRPVHFSCGGALQFRLEIKGSTAIGGREPSRDVNFEDERHIVPGGKFVAVGFQQQIEPLAVVEGKGVEKFEALH